MAKLLIVLAIAAGALAGCSGPKEDNAGVETLSGDAAKNAHLRGPASAGGGAPSGATKAAGTAASPD